MTHQELRLYALPVVVAASMVEGLVLTFRRHGSYDWKAAMVSLFDVAIRNTTQWLPLLLMAPLLQWLWIHRIATVRLDTLWSFLLLFVGQEFAYYWYHRASHRVRWLWLAHSVHHSSNDMNLAAAYRLGVTGKLTGTLLFFLPLIWIGFRPDAVLSALAINLLYQFWIHVAWIPRLGWLEYVFNTPSAHRVHHAANLDYLDANYGGVLIVFDRLFGTYRAEHADEPCRYGLVHPVTTHNPLVIEFGPWRDLWHDLHHARSVAEVAGYLFLPPGWRPDGEGETTEDLRRYAAANKTCGALNHDTLAVHHAVQAAA